MAQWHACCPRDLMETLGWPHSRKRELAALLAARTRQTLTVYADQAV